MKPRNRVPMMMIALLLILGMLVGGVASAQQSTYQSPILVVNTSFLNVRTGPGIEYGVLVTLVGGTEVPVLGIANDGVWYQIATDAGPGWVNRTFTLPRGNFTGVPIVDVGDVGVANLGQGGGGAATPDTASSATARHFTGYSLVGKNIYQDPSYDSLIVNSLTPNDPSVIYPLFATTTDTAGVLWYYIDVPDIGTGWSDAIDMRVLECGTDNVGITIAEAPMRFDGISTRDAFLLPAGVEGYLGGFGGNSNQFIYFELVDGTVGLLPVEAVAERTGVTSRCDLLPAGGVASLGQGGGGMATDEVRTTTPTLTGNRVVVNTGNLNVRMGPGAGYDAVATVAGGTELVVLGRARDAVWYFVQGDFGQGWLNSTFTLFRGNYSTVPVITEPMIVGTEAAASLGQGGGGAATPDTASSASGRGVTGVSLVGHNMHESPSYDSLIINSLVPNDMSVVYPLKAAVTDSSGTIWYLVDAEGVGEGWMDAVMFRLLACGGESVGVTLAETAMRFDGISTRDSFMLPGGTEGYLGNFRGNANQFVEFELVDGTFGLVEFSAVATRSDVTSMCDDVAAMATGTTATTTTTSTTTATPSGNRVVINTGNLNVRGGPGAAFGVVVTLPGGTEVAVAGRTADGFWYLVEGGFGQGWVNADYVVFRGNYGSVAVVTFGS